MTQFKRDLECKAYTFGELTPQGIVKCHQRWAGGLVNVPGSGVEDYDRPVAVLEKMLSDESEKSAPNVIRLQFGKQHEH